MVQSAITFLPPTRQQLLSEIRRRGEARAEELAVAVGITVGGVRQQLMALYGDGLVLYREAAEGPGRPKHYYRLTPSAEALFPDAARDMLPSLAAYLEANAPEILEAFIQRYVSELRRAWPRPVDQALPLEERLEAVVRSMEHQGFMPELERAEDGSYYLNLYHCPLLQLARGTPRICEFTREMVGEVAGSGVKRVAWRRDGDLFCAYRFALPESEANADGKRLESTIVR